MDKAKPKLLTYEPKKTFLEKIRELVKPFLIFLSIILIIGVSSYSTYYILEKNINGQQNNPDNQNAKLGMDTQIKTSSSNQNKPSSSKLTPSLYPPKTSSYITDYSTIKNDLLNDEIIQSLPDDAEVVLKFYNFNKGTRQWEKSFILKKDSIKEGDLSDGDMMIFMHSKYVPEFRTKNLCNILKESNNNGDLGIETDKSKTSLMWKYKKMLSYKDCVGINF